MSDIDEWLNTKVSRLRLFAAPTSDPTEFTMLAGILRAEAEAVGHPAEELEDACGGDISRYLMWRHLPLPSTQ